MSIQNGGHEPEVYVKHLYLRLYTWKPQDSNDYTHVFGVKQHGKTSENTVRYLGVLEIKDGGHWPEVDRK